MDNEAIVQEITKACKEDILLTSIYNILFTNDLAFGRIAELIYQLKISNQYKLRIKQETTRLLKQVKELEKIITEVAGPRIEFLADANQVIEEKCNPHIKLMRIGMNREFKNSGHPHPKLMSYYEAARTLTEMACVNLDYRIKEMNERGIPGAKRVSYLRMTEIFKSIDRLGDLLLVGANGQNKVKGFNLNTNALCMSSIKLLEAILTDAETIGKAISEGERLNPRTFLNEE